jgi:hypothetical protein
MPLPEKPPALAGGVITGLPIIDGCPRPTSACVGKPFARPVDPGVAEVVEAWEQRRPMLDAKAAEMVQYLFAHRGRLLGMAFLNATLIPLLCRKAGVPEADACGKLTSHRYEATHQGQTID